MTNIVIGRCTVRVVRRGGWNWEPSPRRILDGVVRSLPELLARKLPQILAAETDFEFSAPVRVRIPIRLSDLIDDVPTRAATGAWATHESAGSFETRLEEALREALNRWIGPTTEPSQGKREVEAAVDAPRRVMPDGRLLGGALYRLLRAWHDRGELEVRLANFTFAELESWHEKLLVQPGDTRQIPDGVAIEGAEALDDFVIRRIPSDLGGGATERLRQLLILAMQVAAHFRIGPNHPVVRETLDRLLPIGGQRDASVARMRGSDQQQEHPPTGSVARSSGTEPQLPGARLHVPTPTHLSATEAENWEVHVPCALPFLLLGPLAKLGYFEALDAVLDVAELSQEATHFARVLAYKVLDPPERGWRRSPGSIVAATAFAGQRIPIGEEVLTQFAHRIASHTGLLDRLLTDALVLGYTQGRAPMLRCAQDGRPSGFLLTDVQGCFPIAWVEDLATLPSLLEQLGSAVLLVCGTGASPAVLNEIAGLGLSFVTVLAPTRAESWHAVRQGPVRLGWTNHATPSSMLVLQVAHNLARASDESNGLWEALAVARPGIVCADRPALERTATLAAAVAAGTIAWELWRNRERTTPQAALGYFSDLDAYVRFTDESVSVRLPLGRRHDDLSRAGLLDPVFGIPWFGERAVEFGVA